MTDFELRAIESHEINAFASCQAAAFGGRYTPDQLESLAVELQLDRSLAVFDGGDLVATTSSYAVPMTLPGLLRCQVAAVTDVSVAPTHRRRGMLNAMMRRQLDDLRSAGEPVAVLFASEGGIYGRYGYGPATFGARYVLDKRAARVPAPVAAPSDSSLDCSGSVHLVELAQAAEAFPAVFSAYVPTRVGELDRPQGEWAEMLGNPNGSREDERHRFYVCYEQAGHIDGYAVYRVAGTDPANHWRRAVFLEEMCSLSDESYISLWRYLLGLDLTEELRTRNRPVDEPLRYLLEDQRHLRTTSWGDRTWVRLVDVGQALALRRYEEHGSLVIEVLDRFCPWNEGRFRLSVDLDGVGTVEQVEVAPDIALPVEALGAVYLGGVPFAGMATAGRIAECKQGATRRADKMFGLRRPPFCTTNF
ncbi:MAG: GNAT family N-acetyltransferase [Acidimicrobiales bacterium]|jgi:predicted acetyltransferase